MATYDEWMDSGTRRLANFFGFFICSALLAYAYYLQFYQHLEPCPLCIFQRVAVIALGVTFLLAAAHNPKGWGSRIYAVLLALEAIAGIVVAGRHLWLQSLPADQVPECGPGLAYMLEVFPLTDTLRMVFTGSGECAKVDWDLLGLSMPGWVLLWFMLLGIAGLWVNWRSRPSSA
jgi:disulfide bond formation protein DsbB